MMLSIDPIIGSQVTKACSEMARESHRLHRYLCPGRWHGSGAKQMGWLRNVKQERLRAVLDGLDPKGRVRLADNAAEPSRTGGWLFDFTSPATVNALHAVAPTGFANRMEKVHERAVKTALDELENTAKQELGLSMAFAMFQHRVGPGQTPSLHTLVALPNIGWAENGRANEIGKKFVEQHRKGTDMLYVMTYANGLERAQLNIKMDRDGFRVGGVPDNAAKLLANEFGANRGRGLDLFEAWNKPVLRSQTDLQDRWDDIGSKAEWGAKQAKDLVKYNKSHHTKSAETTTSTKSQSSQDHGMGH